MLKLLFSIQILFGLFGLQAQVSLQDPLYQQVMAGDSLMFEQGFNRCDRAAMDSAISADFEFYHDKNGAVLSKKGFIASFQKNLCGNPHYKARRELVKGSTKVFPLYKDGHVLYGALQHSSHRFYESIKQKPEVCTGEAKITHLWLLENTKWKLARSISYDHTPVPAAPLVDTALVQAWHAFVHALTHNDFSALSVLTSDCVYCIDCVTNTPKEATAFEKYKAKHPDTWYHELNTQKGYIPKEQFLKQDLSLLVDAQSKTNLLDASKLSFYEDTTNTNLYQKSCMATLQENGDGIVLREVLVTVISPSKEFDGLQKAFAFVKTKTGYKFSGYSTIP